MWVNILINVFIVSSIMLCLTTVHSLVREYQSDKKAKA